MNSDLKDRICVGLTMGDPAGIGAEVALKALACENVYERCVPVVIGDRAALEDARRFCGLNLSLRQIASPSEARGEPGAVDFIDLARLMPGDWKYGKPQAICGEASFQYLLRAIQLAERHEIEAVVTAPINKEALWMAGHPFAGHTEILAKYTNARRYAMLLESGKLRVIHVSTHVSLREACDRVKRERVLDVILLAREGLRLLGIEDPVIGVAGLNPHCSENGMFGREEREEIIPAIEDARALGCRVIGPEAPDTVFVKCLGGLYDVIVAMYHDQGHIPLKLAGFHMDPETGAYTSMRGVNCTIGLPFVRTSVDHGTAYGKAGEGRANAQSMLDAIFASVEMAENSLRR